MTIFESPEMSLEFNCSLPRRNPERAGSIQHTPLPPPSCTHLLSLWSVEERWAGTYSGPGCLFHLQECCPEWCPGERAGLQRSRVCSCLCPCSRVSMERWGLRVWFTSQQMGKNRWEGGEWGNGGFGVSHLQCVISPPSIVLLLPVCVCLLSHLVWSDSETPWNVAYQAPLSCFCLLGWNAQELQFSNLTLSVVSWKHRIWFYRWNFAQYGHTRSIPAPRAVYDTWWLVSEWMRADHRTVKWSAVC